jgi:hypothetical protein
MPRELSEGERHLSAYLRQRGWVSEHEADVGGRRPDFLVRHAAAGRIAFEVYEPEIEPPFADPTKPAVEPLDNHIAYQRMFAGRKADQIKAAKSAGVPYVAVISGSRSWIPIEPLVLASAMFGQLQVTVSVSTDPNVEVDPNPRTTFGPGARLQPSLNRGVSAAAIVSIFNPTSWRVERAIAAKLARLDARESERERFRAAWRIAQETYAHFTETGGYDEHARVARLVLMHNPHAEHPLPRGLIGPHDVEWAWSSVGDGLYGVVAEGVHVREVEPKPNLDFFEP